MRLSGNKTQIGDVGDTMPFYTGYSHNATFQQTICHATSDDMISWEKDPNNPILVADTSQWEPADWRDPYVYYGEDKGCYAMLIAARLNEGLEDSRVSGTASSTPIPGSRISNTSTTTQ